MRLVATTFVMLALASGACRPPTDGDGDGDGDADADAEVSCTPGNVDCEGNVARWCNETGDGFSATQACEGATPLCVSGYGCVVCMPGQRYCEGQDVVQCNDDGSHAEVLETCSPARPCTAGMCRDACEDAASTNSYEGCEYVAATLMNSGVAPEFTPAVVVSNRNGDAAEVTVTRGATVVATARVEPNATHAIELPWVDELKQDLDRLDTSVEHSANVADGAYRVTSTLPVTVYQFNPLEYRIGRDCAGEDDMPDGQCFSYSNDASLLLPVHVLTEHYIVMSRPNLGIQNRVRDLLFGGIQELYSFSPSVMAVVNPQPSRVTVDVTFSCPTQAGPGLLEYEAGTSGSFSIEPGGVLQIAARIPERCTPDWTEPSSVPCGDGLYECTYSYCEMAGHDLTGTEVTASMPVAVFGAHNCAFIPFNRWACDHLEEQLFPFETWGTHFVVSQSHRENGEPDVIRVMSGEAGNTIRFTPGSVHSPVTLDRGRFVEFEAHGAFEIDSDGPILVGQFIVGQSYNSTTTELPPGDPAFSLGVPVEQYRSAYNFLAPDTYERSYVNITTTAAASGSIALDGADLSGGVWHAIEGSDYVTLRHELPPGSHSIVSTTSSPFGIVVYGYGQYTSYMFPGGLDLEEIAIW